jgi:hypothetical protein
MIAFSEDRQESKKTDRFTSLIQTDLSIHISSQVYGTKDIYTIVRGSVSFPVSLFHPARTDLMQVGLLDQLSFLRERLLAFNKAIRSDLEEEESYYSRASGHSSPQGGIHHSRLAPSEPAFHFQSEPPKPSSSPRRPIAVPLSNPAVASSDDSDSAGHQTTEVLSDSEVYEKSPTGKRSLPVDDGRKPLTGTKDAASRAGKQQPKATSKTAVSPIPVKKEKPAKPRSPVSIYFSTGEDNLKPLDNSLLNLNDFLGESESGDEAGDDEV